MTLIPAQLQQRWATYTAQEKAIWSGLAGGLLAVLIWLYVLQPLADRHAAAEQSLAQAEDALQLLQHAAPRLQMITGADAGSVDTVQSMTNLLSQTAGNNSVELTRFEQSGADGLRLWLDNQPFDRVLAWLAELDSYGVEVDQLTLSQGNRSGTVTVRGVVARR
ncbi:MAG: type II secretion system protein M [Natronospirillum sp.]|uniref:type II secretion system protein M n=1 Tax=Natronospirillum sp. TaxID=2812955 RepID=UPI0025E738DC|nr:type II secretion system protein M [Natronospirillum sp.]MCH8551043.1 type II secretion system protein M [Natronospirillum sp.]